jgi:hypothetical protein
VGQMVHVSVILGGDEPIELRKRKESAELGGGSNIMLDFLCTDAYECTRRQIAEALDLVVAEDSSKPEAITAAATGSKNATLAGVAR